MHTALESMVIAKLRARVRGEVIGPSDARYERARRVWNGRMNRYPALIVYCADPDDVLTAIDFARSVGLPITVRGGGHSMVGFSVSNDAIVIDLSRLKGLQIDPWTGITRVQAGLTLGGGIGWLMGTYGLTVDNLLSKGVVNVDGTPGPNF